MWCLVVCLQFLELRAAIDGCLVGLFGVLMSSINVVLRGGATMVGFSLFVN